MSTEKDTELKEAGLTSEGMQAIRQDFVKKVTSYEHTAQYITNLLLKTPGVHSVRYRVKNPLHLHKKIVRKKLENNERVITLATYEEEITDLAGIRILHLFKSDWQHIHKFIMNTWTLKERPIAYHRQGDSPAFLKMFEECDIKEHPYGYRSVHYIIETSPTKAKRYIELQVRTIFEEGWSEIDHKVRYPSFSDNPLTNSLLMILNRLAGSADEMSSFVQELSIHLEQSQHELEKMQEERDEQIAKLNSLIDNPETSKQIKSTLEGVAKSISHSPQFILPPDAMAGVLNVIKSNFLSINEGIFRNAGAGGLANLHQTNAIDKVMDMVAEEAEKTNQHLQRQKKGIKTKRKPKPKPTTSPDA
ncbi:RelA/SpoT domain-containing protein [Hymenobacter sp. BT683]|uniref:RelA/SpoT domain-containing protein n=1 Tax=Hymenobacter jeongseonensis TaxID=2791027 RepID=A0ABS0IMD2_9BACT|nr:RelA/SpoT domain-containing protein [Hymenobacter jeongseonensis]MBF9239503.1 RelA/SpoT domain-containing protein [Hymenobacter jeongseonensis]